LRENNLQASRFQSVMHVSSEYKLTALLKGGAGTAQRLFDAATQLRAALTPERVRARWASQGARAPLRFLVAPYELLASRRAATGVAIGVAACSVALAIAAEVHFDGALDVHRVKGLLGPMTLTADLAISWVLVASILWIASLMADRSAGREDARPSLRDFLVAVGVARLPTLLIALCIAVLPEPQMLVESLLRGAILLPLFAWYVGLLYTGFGHASGLRGQSALIPFLAGLVTAEAISKAIIGSV
jgi:hypothetical protein